MLTQKQALDRYYLDVRCHLIEIAATLDRFDRYESDSSGQESLEKLKGAIALLAEPSAKPDRAERLLFHFSDPA